MDGALPKVDARRTIRNVGAASVREDQKTTDWIQEVEDPETVTVEVLDKRLSAALHRIAHGEFGRTITDRVDQSMRAKRAIRWRELLRRIARYYHSNQTYVY